MSDVHTLSGAYAVDALDAEESVQFERHLTECPACSREVDSFKDAAAHLALTTAVEPSAPLRERMVAGISRVRPLPPVIAGSAPAAPFTSPARGPRRRRRVVGFLGAAGAAVVIGTSGVVWHQMSEDYRGSAYGAVVAADDSQTFTVPVDQGGTTSVVRSKKLNMAYVVTTGLPSAPTGHHYVLWLQHDSIMTPAGVLPVRSDNKVLLAGDVATASGLAVTVEDAGTEPNQPSDEVLATVSFEG